MKIAIIGCGDVGRCYATALTNAGYLVTNLCDSRTDSAIADYANALGSTLHSTPGSWLSSVDLVIAAVFGGVALDVARQSIPYMKESAIYADFTTGNPEDLRAAGELAVAAQVKYVDVAISGAIGLGGAKTPLLCAGSAAEEFIDIIKNISAPARVVGTEAGDAVALKLLRSVFTKGMEALSVECLMAAEQKGLRQELYEVLSDFDQSPICDFMEMFVTTHIKHASRRLKEVQEARRLLQKDGVQPLVIDGVEALFQRTSDAIATHPLQSEPTIQNSLNWLFEEQKAR